MGCERIPERVINTFGDYSLYEDAVYQAYLDTFANKKFTYDGKRITEKRYPMINGRSGTFWHIVSSGNTEDLKLPDFDRYETVRWPGYILGYCIDNCATKLIWENKRHSKTRLLIYCTEIQYLVVLDKREDFYVFWTAYPVKYKHTKEKLLKEYNEYQEKTK